MTGHRLRENQLLFLLIWKLRFSSLLNDPMPATWLLWKLNYSREVCHPVFVLTNARIPAVTSLSSQLRLDFPHLRLAVVCHQQVNQRRVPQRVPALVGSYTRYHRVKHSTRGSSHVRTSRHLLTCCRRLVGSSWYRLYSLSKGHSE